VLLSSAAAACPDYAIRCLVAIACRNNTSRDPEYRKKNGPGNNGLLSLPVPGAAEFGIAPSWRVVAGLQLLVLADLIVRTRQGHIRNGRGIPSLYALAWLPIAPSSQYDGALGDRTLPTKAAHKYLQWRPPDDWAAIEYRVRTIAQGGKAALDKKLPLKTSWTKDAVTSKGACTKPSKTACTKPGISRPRQLVSFMNSAGDPWPKEAANDPSH
jgi:hypothetical protein